MREFVGHYSSFLLIASIFEEVFCIYALENENELKYIG